MAINMDGLLDIFKNPFGERRRSNDNVDAEAQRAMVSKRAGERRTQLEELRRSILTDTTIDNLTRQDLVKGLTGLDVMSGLTASGNFDNAFGNISRVFKEAQTGEGFHGSRKATEELQNFLSNKQNTRVAKSSDRLTSLLGS